RAADCSWAATARRISYSNLASPAAKRRLVNTGQKLPSAAECVAGRLLRRKRVSGRICLAHGSIASVCTDRISLVSSLAAAISEVGLDAADHHLDSEH